MMRTYHEHFSRQPGSSLQKTQLNTVLLVKCVRMSALCQSRRTKKFQFGDLSPKTKGYIAYETEIHL